MIFERAKIEKPRNFKRYLPHPKPSNWSILENINWNQKIIVELGCGTGEFSLFEAEKNPNSIYIAIEKTEIRSKILLKNSNLKKLKNLFSIRADGILLIDCEFPKQSIDELYVFYPNPWPKKSQSNKRFFVSASFEILHHALKPDGFIYITSNIKDYIDEAAVFLESFWNYRIEFNRSINSQVIPRTSFEKNYLKNNEEIFELKVSQNPFHQN